MDTRNDKFRDFHGVTAWHKAGYTGKRGLSATGEDFSKDPYGHAGKTYDVFKEIAPDRELIFISMSGKVPLNYTRMVSEIVTKRVDSMFMSFMIDGYTAARYDPIFNPLKGFCSLFNSIGNDGIDNFSAATRSNYIHGVGAITLDSLGNITRAGYSSVSENIDFMALTDIYIQRTLFDGTSCSAPVLCGMAALVNDFFIDKTGSPLSNEAMYRFLKDNTVDMRTDGHDDYTGWGYVVLPAPETVDISKYANITEKPESSGEAEATPVSVPDVGGGNMFKIALGAGHGLRTEGKRCLKALDPNETREWWLNDRICDYVESFLKDYEGYSLLRLDDSDDGKDDIALATRVKQANDWGADFYLSVHHNAGINGGSGGGIMAFSHPDGSAASVAWRDALYDKLIAHTGLKGNRSQPKATANFYVLKHTTMPAVLLELGFMDSKTDVPVILTNEYAQQCARAIVETIVAKGKLTKKVSVPADDSALYKVQLGAFSKKENAERLAAELKAKGYATYIVKM